MTTLLWAETGLRVVVGFAIAILTVVALVKGNQWYRSIFKIRVPVREKLLRAPGESCRMKMEEVNEKLETYIGLLLLWPVMVSLICPVPVQFSYVASFVLIYAGIIYQWWKIKVERNNYWLGMQGERAVGEELNKLMLDGCHVFHDVQKPDSNIDHVVISPTGVFAIETKTRRRRKANPGKEDHMLVYDGNKIEFPTGCYEGKSLTQTKANAVWLKTWLSKAMAESIEVTPILTFPGWYVERKGRGEFPVVAPKEIRKIICTGSAVLDDKQMKQLAHHIGDKCRDVEF